MPPDLFLLFVIGPAVIGIGALVAGIVLLRRDRRNGASYWTPLAVLLLLLAFGIATCYAVVFLSSGPH